MVLSVATAARLATALAGAVGMPCRGTGTTIITTATTRPVRPVVFV